MVVACSMLFHPSKIMPPVTLNSAGRLSVMATSWKTDMLDPTTWGDEVVLSLASNLLEVDIIIIPAFRESADQVTGVTTVKPLIHAKHQSIHLFHFSECDFTSPHYKSVFPRLSRI